MKIDLFTNFFVPGEEPNGNTNSKESEDGTGSIFIALMDQIQAILQNTPGETASSARNDEDKSDSTQASEIALFGECVSTALTANAVQENLSQYIAIDPANVPIGEAKGLQLGIVDPAPLLALKVFLANEVRSDAPLVVADKSAQTAFAEAAAEVEISSQGISVSSNVGSFTNRGVSESSSAGLPRWEAPDRAIALRFSTASLDTNLLLGSGETNLQSSEPPGGEFHTRVTQGVPREEGQATIVTPVRAETEMRSSEFHLRHHGMPLSEGADFELGEASLFSGHGPKTSDLPKASGTSTTDFSNNSGSDQPGTSHRPSTQSTFSPVSNTEKAATIVRPDAQSPAISAGDSPEPIRPVKHVSDKNAGDSFGAVPQQPSSVNVKELSSPRASTQSAARDPEFLFQLGERIHAQVQEGEDVIRIQLKPDKLGRLEIKAENWAGGVVARIVAESSGVKNFLENNLHILQQSLQERGLRVERIDVTVQESLDPRSSSGQERFGQSGSRHDREAPQPPAAVVASIALRLEEADLESPRYSFFRPNTTFHTIA